MQLGNYDLVEVIGKGGMGTVYRAVDRTTGALVAVKVFPAHIAADRLTRRRLEQEYAAARLLRHPNIVRGLDAVLKGDSPYLVMELVEGESLTRRVYEQGPLPLGPARRLIAEVADALDLAHSRSLVHRDVKPDNVLITPEGQAKLTDLGLVKDLSAEEALTRSGTWLGTIGYMAPEQFGDARHVDPTSDVYALAATLYFALTGACPFQGGNLTVLGKKLKGEFSPPSKLVRSLPPEVDQALVQGLAAKPRSRPRSCRELVDLLPEGGPEGGSASPPAAARARAAGPGQSERRRSVRYPASRPASCRAVRGDPRRWVSEILDVSKSGVQVKVGRRFEPGTVLELEVHDDHAGSTVMFVARACWAREITDSTWAVGCAFGRPLDEGDLAVFIGERSGTVVIHPAR